MQDVKVVKRNGELVDFDQERIKNAIQKAVIATKSQVTDETIDQLVFDIVSEIKTRFYDFFPNVENIQDIVEKHLVKNGFYEISKAYIIYRAEKQKQREEKREQAIKKSLIGKLTVVKRDGKKVIFDIKKLQETLKRASNGFEKDISIDLITKETLKNVFDGIATSDIEKAMVLGTTCFVEKDPAYGFVAARIFNQRIYKEVIGKSTTGENLEKEYRKAFVHGIKTAVKENHVEKRLLDFDLQKLSERLIIERDNIFAFMGIHTLYERYFLKINEKRIELPQAFWMRVAMGLSLNEKDKESKAIEFYDLISTMRFVPSTPTLFHSGTIHPQLSSCYLTTVKDDLKHIFKCIADNAQLSKWSGGLGNDWTSIRAIGAHIKSTNVESQGVIPFLKIANDVTAAINRSGKRRGATCAYLETWHADIEDFLELRKNTGDERRRTHDMNTANWIPDLFMKRVLLGQNWTLFSPEEVPELHDLYGKEFEKKYAEYEQMAKNGQIKKFKTVPALKLWRKMIGMLFETGHPWFTFKDPSNIRSPQDHTGVVHSSNLCTEITLNTSEDETAVCNLGSISIEKHIENGKLNYEMLAHTIGIAVRMLDNVIDINFYPTIEAQNSNFRHRPVGLGIMGFQDALFKLDMPFDSEQALKFSDALMEFISYHAIISSSKLAKERGPYESYKGSKWDRGLLPFDTLKLLEEQRGMKLEVNKDVSMDWTPVREHIKKSGMRNSNVMAIAPTATISTISGCFPSIEPVYKNIYVKANMSGEFTIVNPYLVQDLKELGKWNQEMLDQIKYYDGNIQLIATIPQKLKDKYKEAFEIDAELSIDLTAARAKWIDQSQSHNVFLKGISGKKLSDTYIHAWKTGLKTTYYLRTLGATQIEKSTLDAKTFGFTQKREYTALEENSGRTQSATVTEVKTKETIVPQKQAGGVIMESFVTSGAPTPEVKACLIEDPDCEACQ